MRSTTKKHDRSYYRIESPLVAINIATCDDASIPATGVPDTFPASRLAKLNIGSTAV
jgi:hypothetical protein